MQIRIQSDPYYFTGFGYIENHKSWSVLMFVKITDGIYYVWLEILYQITIQVFY